MVFHTLIGLLLCRFFGINFLPGILVGILVAVFPDFDHLPHLKEAFKSRRFGAESRSTIHEFIGIVIILATVLTMNFVYPQLFFLTLTCGLSHFVVDFLTRPSRPLYPFSKEEIHLHLYPTEQRKIFIYDTILTTALGIIYVAIILT